MHLNMQQPATRKPKQKTKKLTYKQKLAEYNEAIPVSLPNIPTRSPEEEFARAHWHDLHFNGHKEPHLYGVPLHEPGQDPATAVFVIDG